MRIVNHFYENAHHDYPFLRFSNLTSVIVFQDTNGNSRTFRPDQSEAVSTLQADLPVIPDQAELEVKVKVAK